MYQPSGLQVYVLASCLSWRRACVSTRTSERIIHPTDSPPVDLEARVQELELKEKSPHPHPHMIEVGDTRMTLDNASIAQSPTLVPAVESPNIIPSTRSVTHLETQPLEYGRRYTASSEHSSQYSNVDAVSTVMSPHGTFDPLSSNAVTELCAAWFERYHPWFPILHQPSLLASLQGSPTVASCDRYLLIKAIVAVTIDHCQSCPSTIGERLKWSESLRDSVLIEAIGNISLQSIQSLLILSNMEFGAGRTSRFWNLMALCKRYVSGL